MTDQELTLQAVSKAQSIIEEYLQPRPHNHERDFGTRPAK